MFIIFILIKLDIMLFIRIKIKNKLFNCFLNKMICLINYTFTISVVNWTQNYWDYCLGAGSTQWTSWLDWYVLSSGTCSYDKTSWANYTAPTYLTREVTATSPAGVGAPVAAATVASVGASFATGSSPVVAGLGISQCQSIQALSMFNMNTPDNYVSYSQGYEVTKLNFKFVNGIGLQDSMLKGTRRNLSTGYKSLSNIGFSSGNFFVNYIYFFLVLLILIIVHLIVSLMLLCFNKKDNQSKWKRWLSWTKRGFEFGWYLNLFFFASLFIFILALNDMAGKDTSTGLNIFSFILSIIFFIFMIVLTIFPLFILWRKQSKLATLHHNREELN